MPLDKTFEAALHSPQPLSELRSLARDLAEKGHPREEIIAVFEGARQELRALNREADEDAVMDVMDFLVGWCSRHMELLPSPTDEALIGPGQADLKI